MQYTTTRNRTKKVHQSNYNKGDPQHRPISSNNRGLHCRYPIFAFPGEPVGLYHETALLSLQS